MPFYYPQSPENMIPQYDQPTLESVTKFKQHTGGAEMIVDVWMENFFTAME